ncbi:DDE-type integrase/transposase/recombinase [Paenibacillus frigoriresistens]|nr:DDE-type integrase/transposase/recombinase [Paenibacillus frigoriresistens]
METKLPRVITLDKNPAIPPAIQELINEIALPKETLIRQTKYLNNIVEQDHRFIKKITKPMFGFKSFLTAEQTLKGIEAIHMIWNGQAENNSSVLSAVIVNYNLLGTCYLFYFLHHNRQNKLITEVACPLMMKKIEEGLPLFTASPYKTHDKAS